jgi:hypothetical protein
MPLTSYLSLENPDETVMMRAGEPLGADRSQTMFRHRRRTGEIRVRGIDSRTGRQVYPRADEVLIFSRTTPNRLVRRDGSWLGNLEVFIVAPAEAKIIDALVAFSHERSGEKEIVVKPAAKDRFGTEFKDRLWREARRRMDPGSKLGKGNPGKSGG